MMHQVLGHKARIGPVDKKEESTLAALQSNNSIIVPDHSLYPLHHERHILPLSIESKYKYHNDWILNYLRVGPL
jgi:hypothetical protein